MISFMTWPRSRYHELCRHSVEVWVYKPSKTTIKRWHCRGNEKNKLKQQSALNIQITEDNLKILLRILSKIYSILLPMITSTLVTTHYMPGHRYTQSEYALQQVVESFGNLLFSLEKQHWTHAYRVVLRFRKLENINYLVLRYLCTGALPFEELSEEWLFDGEV